MCKQFYLNRGNFGTLDQIFYNFLSFRQNFKTLVLNFETFKQNVETYVQDFVTCTQILTHLIKLLILLNNF